MGRVAGVQTYENLLRILLILRSAPKIMVSGHKEPIRAMDVKQVHQVLENQGEKLSEKTVNKYLKQLETHRPPEVRVVHTGDNNKNYWALSANSPLNDSAISDFEAAMIYLSSEVLESILPPTLKKHLAINREHGREIVNSARPIGILPANSPQWALKLVNRVWVEKPPVLNGEIQEEIFSAVRAKKRLRISYLSNERRHAGESPIISEVSPVRIIQHGDARLYLIVTDSSNEKLFDHHDVRHGEYRRLAVHRIKSAEQLDQDAVYPEEIHQQIDAEPGFGWEGQIELKALISTGIALRLEECPLNNSQKLTMREGSDWHLLEVTIDQNWELRWWVLSHGKHIMIQEPARFREEIIEHFATGFAQYQSNP